MKLDLNNHGRHYHINSKDAFFSMGTLLTGAPYAKRHYELSNLSGINSQVKWGHRAIGFVESLPIIGLIAAIIERTLYESKTSSTNQTKDSVTQTTTAHSTKIGSYFRPKEPIYAIQPTGFIIEIGEKMKSESFKIQLIGHIKTLRRNLGASVHNLALLQKTLLNKNTLLKEREITVSNITPSSINLETIYTLPINQSTLPPPISFTKEFFNYKDLNHFYIDFAHPTSFGGAYATYGTVQEERLFIEFCALPVLDILRASKGGIHPCVDQYEEESNPKIVPKHTLAPPTAKAAPFIIEGLYRNYDISGVPYGQICTQAEIDKWNANSIKKVIDPVSVNILGLAAMDYRNLENPTYQLQDLRYMLDAAYLGFAGARQSNHDRNIDQTVIHTADWGCGAFKNNERVITAIQYLAARMAGVELVYHAVGLSSNKENYTQDAVNQSIEFVSDLIESGETPANILNKILEQSLSNKGWKMKA